MAKHLLPGWSCLPQDILSEILDKLLPTDHVRCAVVCKEWHGVVKEFYQTTSPSLNVLPMLMIPSQRKLYSISEQKVYNNFMVPEPCNIPTRSCGSSNAPGWLATVGLLGEHELSTTLVNVFNRDVTPIRLPPLVFNSLQGVWSRVFFPKVILSSDPIANPDSYVAVATYDGTPWFANFAFIKGRQTSWTYLKTEASFTDAIFYKSQVYAVGHWGWISSLDVDSTPLKENVLIPEEQPFPCYAHKEYLVETTKGDLLHVRRFLKQKKNIGYSIHFEDKEFWTESFKVYKVVFDERDGSVTTQVELTSIGDEALFVGDNHSMCVLASNFSGCQPNSIYYTDDLIELGAVRILDDGSIDPDPDDIFSLVQLLKETMANGPSDMGIFNLEDGSFTRHYSLNPWHKNIPPAVWIMPSFKGLS